MTILSLIITTCNRHGHLIRCVSSIAASSCIPDEIIIIDDCSRDETVHMTDEDIQAFFPSAVCRVIHTSSPVHMVRARNLGAEHSNGAYMLFVDDDNEVDPAMCEHLLAYMQENPRCGVVGPAMYTLSTRTKYLNYQTLNLFTGKTTGHCEEHEKDTYNSDGVPNVFMVRRDAWEAVGHFDEKLIQTFTEPDFAYTLRSKGYACVMLSAALTYHDIPATTTIRSFGSVFPQKAYCTMRNRALLITRYGRRYHRIVYVCVFSWIWPVLYSLIAIHAKRADLLRFYWRGWRDGVYYAITGRLRNSLPKLLRSS